MWESSGLGLELFHAAFGVTDEHQNAKVDHCEADPCLRCVHHLRPILRF